MSMREHSEGSKTFEPEVNSGHRYTHREMISYSIRVRVVNPLMFGEVNLDISIYRWTSVMEHILCNEKKKKRKKEEEDR